MTTEPSVFGTWSWAGRLAKQLFRARRSPPSAPRQDRRLRGPHPDCRPGLRRGTAYGGCRVLFGYPTLSRVPLRPIAETTAWTNLSAWCTIRPKRCWRIWAPGAPKKPIDTSYKLLVIISQGCATYSGDCFKNTVEAVIRNGDQGYNPA